MLDFTNRCVSTLEANGDEASKVEKYDEALAAFSIALSLIDSPSMSCTLLIKWARLILVRGSANEALDAAATVRVSQCILKLNVDFLLLQFQVPKSLIYQTICDVLEQDGRVTEVIQCFQKMQDDLPQETSMCTAWELGE